MKKTIGLWIDHRKAVIATVAKEAKSTTEIRSNIDRQPSRFAGLRSTAQFRQESQPADNFPGHLNRYYDEVIAVIRGADSILLFGPGAAKGELKRRLEKNQLGERIVTVEIAQMMSDRQVAAKTLQYFQEASGS